MRRFGPYFNDRPHEGLALFTPADVFHDRVPTVAAVHQQALIDHYARHAERYVKGAPSVALPPTEVHINYDLAMDATQLLDPAGALRIVPTLVDTGLPEIATWKSPAGCWETVDTLWGNTHSGAASAQVPIRCPWPG